MKWNIYMCRVSWYNINKYFTFILISYTFRYYLCIFWYRYIFGEHKLTNWFSYTKMYLDGLNINMLYFTWKPPFINSSTGIPSLSVVQLKYNCTNCDNIFLHITIIVSSNLITTKNMMWLVVGDKKNMFYFKHQRMI